MLKELGHLPNADEAAATLTAPGAAGLSAVHFNLETTAWWEAEPRNLQLDVILGQELDARDPRCFCLVTEAGGLDDMRGHRLDTHTDLLQACMRAGVTPVDLSKPIPLHPVSIPKPWGREIWFSGIEARGVARAGSAPLPWLRAAAGKLLDGRATEERAPVLLKLLAPHPDPNFGELYFEAHREKTEVYIVTDVDPKAWPDGAGQMRLGFNAARVQELGEAGFRAAYLAAAQAYKLLRDEADELFADLREPLGIPTDAVVDLSIAQAWHATLPGELQRALADARDSLAGYSNFVTLAPGDVVCVKPGTPHALQHGVSVIEFQTPHYERAILSFSQQVVTQQGWDTEDALGFVNFGTPPPSDAVTVFDGDGCLLERIADFDTFEVLRATLDVGASYTVNSDSYSIAVGLTGEINQGNVDARHALYLPAQRAHRFTNSGDAAARLLVAIPTD